MLVAAMIGVMVLIAGYYALRSSPVFNVSTVTVAGGDAKLDATIQATAEQAAEGHSLLAVNSGAIQQAIEAMPWVRSATVDRAFPSTLAVRVDMYVPEVAATTAGHTYLVASDAHVIATAKQAPKGVPTVALPKGAGLVAGHPATSTDLAAAMLLLHKTPAWFTKKYGQTSAIAVSRAGTVTATVGGGMLVAFGTPANLDLKMAEVDQMLGKLDDPGQTVKSIDVSAPRNPAIVPRKTKAQL